MKQLECKYDQKQVEEIYDFAPKNNQTRENSGETTEDEDYNIANGAL